MTYDMNDTAYASFCIVMFQCALPCHSEPTELSGACRLRLCPWYTSHQAPQNSVSGVVRAEPFVWLPVHSSDTQPHLRHLRPCCSSSSCSRLQNRALLKHSPLPVSASMQNLPAGMTVLGGPSGGPRLLSGGIVRRRPCRARPGQEGLGRQPTVQACSAVPQPEAAASAHGIPAVLWPSPQLQPQPQAALGDRLDAFSTRVALERLWQLGTSETTTALPTHHQAPLQAGPPPPTEERPPPTHPNEPKPDFFANVRSGAGGSVRAWLPACGASAAGAVGLTHMCCMCRWGMPFAHSGMTFPTYSIMT